MRRKKNSGDSDEDGDEDGDRDGNEHHHARTRCARLERVQTPKAQCYCTTSTLDITPWRLQRRKGLRRRQGSGVQIQREARFSMALLLRQRVTEEKRVVVWQQSQSRAEQSPVPVH